MSTHLNDKYQGEYKDCWYHGYGKLKIDNDVIYQGQFIKGHFHGEGNLIYPNGNYYKATWQEGKMINGELIFADNLKYQTEDWTHCRGNDRRFYQQSLNGIRPSGATQQTKQQSPHHIPAGTYDAGDGYYEPVKSIIYTWDGKILRNPSQQQVEFIMAKCRYVPKLVEISGAKDFMIRKVVEKDAEKQTV